MPALRQRAVRTHQPRVPAQQRLVPVHIRALAGFDGKKDCQHPEIKNYEEKLIS